MADRRKGRDTVWVDCFYYGFQMLRKDYMLYSICGKSMPELQNGEDGEWRARERSVSRVLERERATLCTYDPRDAYSTDEKLSIYMSIT